MKNSPYHENLVKLGIINREYCDSDEEKKLRAMTDKELPDDVFSAYDDRGFGYTYCRYSDIPCDKKTELLLLSTALSLKSIKGYLLFFVILTIISLVISILAIVL